MRATGAQLLLKQVLSERAYGSKMLRNGMSRKDLPQGLKSLRENQDFQT